MAHSNWAARLLALGMLLGLGNGSVVADHPAGTSPSVKLAGHEQQRVPGIGASVQDSAPVDRDGNGRCDSEHPCGDRVLRGEVALTDGPDLPPGAVLDIAIEVLNVHEGRLVMDPFTVSD
ncbi:MAG: hypothetical protein WBG92_01800 [Thiohalocapsa sp.]